MARRGFLAELHYQNQQAEKRRRQQQAAAQRAEAAYRRDAERRAREAERLRAAAARADAAERKEAERQAKVAHQEARIAEVAEANATLAAQYAAIDGMLAATLDVDDYVDLATLKIDKVEHPEFDPGALGTSTPRIPKLVLPPEPAYTEPAAPNALAAAFGGRKRHEQAVAAARAAHDAAVEQWRLQCAELRQAHEAQVADREQTEARRLEQLAAAEAQYRSECEQREAEAEAHNRRIDEFINNLAFDVPDAIQEYVGVVLANSIYPDEFPVLHEHSFDLGSRELTLTVTVPDPDSVPSVKEYRYVKAKDEITSTALPAREQKERYANAVWQVAVRTLHEVFEADRAGKIDSIALTVVANRVSPATGRPEDVPLVVAAADRESFASFDLANVVPHATLAHLGAALSKSPFDLTPADTRAGVRTRKN